MKRFEYRFEHLDESWDVTTSQEDADKIVAARVAWLNDLGSQGWEVIKLKFTASGSPHIFLKRDRDA